MRIFLSIVIAITLFTPLMLADNGTTGHSMEKATCPYTQAKAEGKSTETMDGKVCPVTGKKADGKMACKTEGKCSEKCMKSCDKSQKCSKAATCPNAAKCAAKCGAKAVAEKKLQTTCPVMGGKINKDIYVDHDGKRIYLCCNGCVEKVKADPEKYIKKLEDEGITLATVEKSTI